MPMAKDTNTAPAAIREEDDQEFVRRLADLVRIPPQYAREMRIRTEKVKGPLIEEARRLLAILMRT